MAGANERHFCVLRSAKELPGSTKAAILNAAMWQPGTRITVGYLGGDAELRARVQQAAEEWVGAEMANLSFDFVDDSNADIRVDFQEGNGSWSYLGTDAHQIGSDEATMNFGWISADSPADELRRVVLHEFGHALGLIHEHQNPDTPIPWNRAAVIADLSAPPNSWDEETIENNMFRHYDPSEVTTTPVDADSIMMYPIPASWTTNGFSADLNNDLSEQDRELIRSAYSW